MKYWIYVTIITILFIIWVEYSIGGILFRPNSSGKYYMNISSLINYLLNPLFNKFLWNISVLDVNYIFIIIMSSLIYKYILY